MDPIKQNADDLFLLFNDKERLKAYNITAITIECSRGNARNIKELFQMDLPHEEIKVIVNAEKELIFENFKGTTKLQFEHIGSTSIKGMPGNLNPDGLLMDETSPPSKETIQALVDSGWKFSNWLADMGDLWFWKILESPPLTDISMVLHVTTASNKYGKGMLKMRDMCNEDKEAFEDYKQTKLSASSALEGNSIFPYKRAKSKCKTLQRIRDELGMAGPDIE